MASEGSVLPGLWYPPRSSLSQGAGLGVEPGCLVVRAEDGQELARAPARAVEISARVGSVPRRFSFPDGSLFETRDNDAADRFLKDNGGAGGGFVHWLEQFRLRLAFLVVAVILLAMAVYRFALPALVEVAVAVTPSFVPNVMSQSTLSALDRLVFAESTLAPERQAAIRAGFGRLASHSQRGEQGFRLNFRAGGAVGPNAFALPDGSVVLTDELVGLAGTDDAMILGVLAHEIGHVEHEHSLRQLYRAAGLAGLVMLIAGDVGSAMEDILAQGGGLLALSHSREAEREADRHSVDLMLAAGMDPLAIGRFFERIEALTGSGGGAADMLATHPATAQRRAEIARYAAGRAAK